MRFTSVDEHGVETQDSFSIFNSAPIEQPPGDVDGDSKITASDARLALRRAVDLETYAEGTPEFLACDIDKDGKVTASDARIILRIAVDLESADSYR